MSHTNVTRHRCPACGTTSTRPAIARADGAGHAAWCSRCRDYFQITAVADEEKPAPTGHDSPFVRYRIAATTIDGPAFDEGEQVALRVLATVAPAPLAASRDEAASLHVNDWAGPWREQHNAPSDEHLPITAAEAAALYLWAVGDGQREVPHDVEDMRRVGKALRKLIALAGDALAWEPLDDPELSTICRAVAATLED